PEPAALRRPGGEAEIEPASADHAEGVDRIGLQVRVQAIVTASGNVAAAELYQQRCATDRATHAVARGIPTIREPQLPLRIGALDRVELVRRTVARRETRAVVRKVAEKAAGH